MISAGSMPRKTVNPPLVLDSLDSAASAVWLQRTSITPRIQTAQAIRLVILAACAMIFPLDQTSVSSGRSGWMHSDSSQRPW